MGKLTLKYHPLVKKDIRQIGEVARLSIEKSIQRKLATNPEGFAAPLRSDLGGYWKLRVGYYRVVFKLKRNSVRIFIICHRSEVYKKIFKRI